MKDYFYELETVDPEGSFDFMVTRDPSQVWTDGEMWFKTETYATA